jgi:hypothetical protein
MRQRGEPVDLGRPVVAHRVTVPRDASCGCLLVALLVAVAHEALK